MINFLDAYLPLYHHLRNFYELTNRKQYQEAYDVAMTITELAQKLEDYAKEMNDE